MDKPVFYTYSDGNGNKYVVAPNVVSYVPVKPEESSSGTYSGGKPATTMITPEQFKELNYLFTIAMGNEDVHVQDRVMMSGSISLTKGEEKSNVILKPGCKEQVAIEQILNRLR